MTRIVIISDTHGLHDNIGYIPDGDILIHAGDLTRSGNMDELRTMNQFLDSLPHNHKIIIAGNHDVCFEKNQSNARKLISRATYLQDKIVEVMGLKIYGSPWQPRFGDLAFNLDRGAPLKEVWSKIPNDTDVLVTHGPPFGILDATDVGGHHVGCKDLLEVVLKIKPKVHAFGHIHCSYGVEKNNDTTFINASLCDENYHLANAPIVYDI